MSFCGSSISSLALVESSNPIQLKTRTPMTAMKTLDVGCHPLRVPAKPLLAPDATTRMPKTASSASRTIAPRFGTHFMYRSERMFQVTAIQMKRAPATNSSHPVAAMPPNGLPQKVSIAAMATTESVPPSQTGLLIQYMTAVTAPARCPNASRTHS